jgi:hypothetical protein
MIRTKLLLGSYILLLLAACDNASPQNARTDSGPNTNTMDGSVFDAGSSSTEKDAGIIVVVPPPKDAGSTDSGDRCLSACEPGNCGAVPDGCGKFLQCGDCSDGMICGAVDANKCGYPRAADCKPKTAEEVCSGRCGAVSDGCSHVVICDATNGGETCLDNEQCREARCVDPTPLCIPATCGTKNHGCGRDGNGCGGTIDCGTCVGETVCKFSSTGNTCVPKPPPVECEPLDPIAACAITCGEISDGCSGLIKCEEDPLTRCPDGEACGADGTPGQCGVVGSTSCMPIPVGEACKDKCGQQSDGCGLSYVCDGSNGGVTCTGEDSCGGGGTPNECGKRACIPRTQSEACPGDGIYASCGLQPDNCNGPMIDCGTCPTDQRCGLDKPSVCGKIPTCTPTDPRVACQGKCGTVPNGCSGVHNCESFAEGVTCIGNEYCGANNRPNTCGTPPSSCVPKTCAQLGHSCGLASDGCGRVLNCWPSCSGSMSSGCTGSCGSTSSCLAGSNGEQSCVSGAPPCTGSLCNSVPNDCSSNAPTTLTGTVRTPGRLESGNYVDRLPVPNAIVYIPAEPSVDLPAIFQGVSASNATASCGRCTDEKLVADGQTLLAAAVTDYKGDFVLQGRVPVGAAFKLVVKVGKWRRVIEVPATVATKCASRPLDIQYTRLAADRNDGLTGTTLPKVAVSTGRVDAMECVLRGIGISETEFTAPSGTGRVHMYRANGARMDANQACTGTYTYTQNGSPRTGNCADDRVVSNVAYTKYGCATNQSGCTVWKNDTAMYADQNTINTYDMVVFDCEGGYTNRSANRAKILAYTNAGGRVFASHWSYDWLDQNGTLKDASSWTNSGLTPTSDIGYLSLQNGTVPRPRANATKSVLYRDWLDWQGALTGTTANTLTSPATPQMALTDPRNAAGQTVGAYTDEWMFKGTSSADYFVQQLSFNTPYASPEDQICGRVAFSAFHVATSGGKTLSTADKVFPAECHTGALNAQEKTLAFMLFDLGACVSDGAPPQPPACVPKTSGELCISGRCGLISDGCGNVVDCAGCPSGNYCDGNLCRPQECTPQTCATLGYNCGQHPDGCSGIALGPNAQESCGTCQDGQVCGLNSPGICGGCVQITKDKACEGGRNCGSVSDGCGGAHECGALPCATGFCGGGGANVCGTNPCTPLSPTAACGTKNCGVVADGCGGTVSCGTCTSPLTCGGGGTPNKCGSPMCTPKTIGVACNNLNCGWVSDGCGGAINCGTCDNGGVCGGTSPNVCGGMCDPATCSSAGAQCGTIADQCGGLVNCGPCPAGQVCGAAGANKCGAGQSCVPSSESAACDRTNPDVSKRKCGLVSNGCGGVIDCGGCTDPLKCNGAGDTPNQCSQGTKGCNKVSCGSVVCGAASDGCGGLQNCGTCASGSYCSNGMCVVSPG